MQQCWWVPLAHAEIIDVQGDEVDVGTPRLESIQGDVGFDVSSTAHLDDDEASSMAADEFDPELAAQFGRRLKELEGDEDEDEDDGDMERGDIDEGEDEEEEDEGEMGLDVFGDEDESGDVNGGGNRLQDEDEEEEEFDDESDFEGDSDADQPGNEQAKQKLLLSEEIAELKGTIERKKKDSDTAPNPIIKKRFEDVIQKLTAELVTKQSQLSALENEDRHDVKGDDDASKDSWGNPRPDSNVAAGPIPDAAGNQTAADGSGNILNYSDDGDVFESPVSSPRVDPDT
ncbi:hypothetical protein EV182_001518 [Spiromyces aspiralis]|uniref:Uncharacterized protein n=1 Tax=Spiromyces aspiralis TaxID=68401 RepID=A0ACC1HJB8_9FUNG|nr:hypothetical protein EV182_001518 [Spiromyces aspiralis]